MAEPAALLHPRITTLVADEVVAERARQDDRWGEQNHPDGTGSPAQIARSESTRRDCEAAAASDRLTWCDVLREEVAEAFAESDPGLLRAELLQVAAVAMAWVEHLDRRG